MFGITRSILTAAFALSLAASTVQGQNSTESLSFTEIIANNTELSSLNAAIIQAGLNLSEAFPDAVTIFAPNNAAFANISGVLAKLTEPQYIAHLESVLLMHVISGAVMSTDLTDGMDVEAENNDPITVSLPDDETVIIMAPNSNATVVTPNIESSDGIVHIVDTVLLPKFVTDSLLDLTGTVEGFTIVTELLKLTGLDKLVTDDVTATVFAPTDAAFMALGDDALAYYRNSTAASTALLSGHVITPNIVPTQLMKPGLLEYKTPSGLALNITITESDDPDTPPLYAVNGATISMANGLAINGVIHAISSVLAVPGAEYPPLNNTAPMTPVAPPTTPTAPVKAPSASSATTTTMSSVIVATVVTALFTSSLM